MTPPAPVIVLIDLHVFAIVADSKDAYYFELFEMSRRFLLVGVAVVMWPGTVVQLTFATLLSLIYLLIQHQMAPYANVSDNFISLAASFALAVLFFSCILLKLGFLVELDELRALLSDKLLDVFDVPSGALSVIIFASVVLALVFAAFTIAIQVQTERKRELEASLHMKARRLRWEKDDSEVVPPEIVEKGYHLFLSHGMPAEHHIPRLRMPRGCT